MLLEQSAEQPPAGRERGGGAGAGGGGSWLLGSSFLSGSAVLALPTNWKEEEPNLGRLGWKCMVGMVLRCTK